MTMYSLYTLLVNGQNRRRSIDLILKPWLRHLSLTVCAGPALFYHVLQVAKWYWGCEL
jgi:hypothetical protein